MRALSGRPLGGRLLAGHSSAQRPTGTPDQYPYENPEARALTARFAVQPTSARKGLVDTLVGALKTGGVWAKLDAFYMLAAHTEQAAQQNWIANQYNLTKFSAPTFTVDEGYQGDGVDDRLDTGFVPSAAVAPLYTRNSACLGVWVLTDVTDAMYDIGDGTAAQVSSRHTNASAIRARVNSSTLDNFAAANSLGSTIINRSGASAVEAYRDGVVISTSTTASVAVSSSQVRLLTASSSGGWTTRQIAAGFIGASLTAGEVLALHNAMDDYLTAVGAV